MPEKKNVCFVFGGKSPEHIVSVESCFSLIKEIDLNKYNIHTVYIKKDGRCSTPKEFIKLIPDFLNSKFITVINEKSTKEEYNQFYEILKKSTKFPENTSIEKSMFYENLCNKKYDVVIPVFHGQYGEDGSIQGLFEFTDTPFVSCGVIPSSLTIDKEITKQIFIQNKIPICEYLSIKNYEWISNKSEIINQIEEKFNYPFFTKPAKLGSSIGISKVKNIDELIQSIEQIFQFDNKAIIEEEIKGTEYGICFLGLDNDITLSVPGKLPMGTDFLDFKSKYDDQYFIEGEIPAKLDNITIEQIRKIALKVCKSLQLDIWARIDFFINEKNEIILNEVNPIPGMGSHSVFPLMWKASGIPMKTLIDKGIELAIRRTENKAKLIYEFDYKL